VSSESGISTAPATSPQSSLSSLSCVGENDRKEEERVSVLQDSGQWRAFARLLDHLDEFKGLDNEKDFLSGLGEREVKEENLEEEWRRHCIVVEELGRRLEVQASLRERDKFIVHVGEVIFPLGSSPLFQVRVVTALLASLGWRLGQAQEQGWHAEEKVTRLQEQLEEALALRTTIQKRTKLVAKLCSTHLGTATGEALPGLMRDRASLVARQRVAGRRRELGGRQPDLSHNSHLRR